MALVISMGVLTYGYDSAFIGTTIAQASFMRDFGLDKMSLSEQNAVSSNLTGICMNDSVFLRIFSMEIANSAELRFCWRLLWSTFRRVFS